MRDERERLNGRPFRVPLVATLMSAWSPEVIAGVDRGYAGIVSEQWWDWQFWDVSSLVRCPDAAAE